MREWVYRLFKTEANREEQGAAVGDNARLFLLLDEMRERDARLSPILTRGGAGEAGGPGRVGGCYLGATGTDASQQAFVAGVFRRLIESQDAIAWTAQAKEEDAK